MFLTAALVKKHPARANFVAEVIEILRAGWWLNMETMTWIKIDFVVFYIMMVSWGEWSMANVQTGMIGRIWLSVSTLNHS